MRGNPITVCVPVIKRYDLLREMLHSLQSSTVQPVKICVINNGLDSARLAWALEISPCQVDTFTPKKPLGVAASWNLFLHVKEERLIVNDDIKFAPHSLELMTSRTGDFITGLRGNAFSCFMIRDTCVQKIAKVDQENNKRVRATGKGYFELAPGQFDEAISPDYAYFEDCDYEVRMQSAGIFLTDEFHVDCGIEHVKSATIRVFTEQEKREHRRKFLIAQENYFAKHGRLPEGIERQSA